MATITTDVYFDDAARTAGEAFTINGDGAKLTIRTDTRVHANAPASMTGSIGSTTGTEGEVLYDGRNVRWLAFDTGSGDVPAIGTAITQGAVSGYLLGVYAALDTAPTVVGAVPGMPASGFLKFREVTGGAYVAGALAGITANATGADVTGWIEIVADAGSNHSYGRLCKHTVRGDWFYLANTDGNVGQVIQMPTNGGGVGTECPGIWIETAPSSGEYEYWPGLLGGFATGWHYTHLGAAYTETDARQNFVKCIGNGQVQIGEASDLAATYSNIAAQASTYASIAFTSTYTWADDVITVTTGTTIHLLEVGLEVHLDFSTGDGVDGIYTVTSLVDRYNFTVAAAGSGAGGSVVARPGFRVTFTAHTLGENDLVYCDFTSGLGVDGTYKIYGVTATSTYIINAPHDTTTSGAVDVHSRYNIVCDRHGMSAGYRVYLDFTSGAGTSGLYTILHPAANTSQASTYAWAANVVTVTFTSHGFKIGDTVYLDFTTGGATANDGNYVIVSVPSTSTYTVALAGSGASGAATVYKSSFDVIANNLGSADSGNVTVKQTIGNIPPSGCRTRIPNVIQRECATGSRASNSVPNATLATRPEYVFTNAGELDAEYVYSNWFFSFGQAYRINLKHFSVFEQVTITETADTVTVDDGGVSTYLSGSLMCFYAVSNFAGGTISNFKTFRGNTPASSSQTFYMTFCQNFVITNLVSGVIQYNTSTTSATFFNECYNFTINNTKVLSSSYGVYLSNSSDNTISNTDYCCKLIGYSPATVNTYSFYCTSVSNTMYDGLTFGFNGSIPNVHPYANLIYGNGNINCKFRNMGTRSIPLNAGDWRPNIYSTSSLNTTSGNINSEYFQRIYLDKVRNDLISYINADKNTVVENCSAGLWKHVGKTQIDITNHSLNSILRGNFAAVYYTAGSTSCYGTHFLDIFTSNTKGRYVLKMNEPTAETLPYCTVVSGTVVYNSAGGVFMKAVGCQAIWEDATFRLGHTGFENLAPLMSGGTIGNYTLEYDIDLGNGFSDSWTTMTGANLSAITIDPSIGFRMKIRITTTTINTTAITFLGIYTTSSLAAQTDNLYPLDYASLELTNIIPGTRIFVASLDDYNVILEELYNEVVNDDSVVIAVPYEVDIPIMIRAMYIDGDEATEFIELENTLGIDGLSIRLDQEEDAIYNINAIDGSTVTGVTIDDDNLLVSVDDGSNSISWQEIYAYESYWLSTEEGIRDEGRFIEAVDPVNYIFYNFKIKNTSDPSEPLEITGGWAVDSVTGKSITLIDNTGGTIFNAPDHVVAFSGNADPAEIWTYTTRELSATGVTDIQNGLATSTEIAALPTASENATAVWAEPFSTFIDPLTAGYLLTDIDNEVDESLSLIRGIGSGTGATLNFGSIDDNTAGGAIKGVTFVGIQSANTYLNTLAEDGIKHTITHTGDAIDIVYEFNIGAGRNAAKATFKGYLNSSNDVITVQAYNGSTWDTRTTIIGQNTTANITKDISLLAIHTGTGIDAGKVYLRFVCTGQSSPTLYVDELLVAGVSVGMSAGYADGAIWVREDGNSGTTPFVNGTADNPCPWADALVLSTSLSLNSFSIENEQIITLNADVSGKKFLGHHWKLDLAGYLFEHNTVEGAHVIGVSTGIGRNVFTDCVIGDDTYGATLACAIFNRCGMYTSSGKAFIGECNGQYVFVDCYSLVPGSGTPYFDFSGVPSSTGVNFRRWSGGSNVTLNSFCTTTMEVVTGGGQTFATGGAFVELRGICRSVSVTLGGSETVQIDAVCGPITISGTATAAIVNIYGVTAEITNTSTGSTVNNHAVSQTTIGTVTSTSILDTPANKLLTDVNGKVTVISNEDKEGYEISGTLTTLDDLNNAPALIQRSEPPTIVEIRTELEGVGSKLANIDTLVTNNLDGKISEIEVTVDVPTVEEIAEAILITPANKLLTDVDGKVTVITNEDKSNYTIDGVKTTLDDLNDAPALIQRSEPPTVVEIRTELEKTGTKLNNINNLVNSNLDEKISEITGTTPEQVWSYSTRELSSTGVSSIKSGLATTADLENINIPDMITVEDIWTYNNRTLTTVITSLTPEQIWSYSVRELSTTGVTAIKSGLALSSELASMDILLDSIQSGLISVPSNVWSYNSRSLTAMLDNMTPEQIWQYIKENLEIEGDDISPEEIWQYITENLINVTPEQVWNYETRTLTE
jgi:hypothetical protein